MFRVSYGRHVLTLPYYFLSVVRTNGAKGTVIKHYSVYIAIFLLYLYLQEMLLAIEAGNVR